jgi:CspA family cold shock protein
MTDRVFGRVKWFDHGKGFGFLTRDDGQADVFVHISVLERSGLTTLREGDAVAFEVRENRNRPGRLQATQIVPAVERSGGATA